MSFSVHFHYVFCMFFSCLLKILLTSSRTEQGLYKNIVFLSPYNCILYRFFALVVGFVKLSFSSNFSQVAVSSCEF